MKIEVTCNSEERNHLEEHLSRFILEHFCSYADPSFCAKRLCVNCEYSLRNLVTWHRESGAAQDKQQVAETQYER